MTDPRPSLWTRWRHLAGFIFIGVVAVILLADVVVEAISPTGDIPQADMAPDPVFMATERDFRWNDRRGDPAGLWHAMDCLNVDRWDGRRWRQYLASSAATDGWVPVDEAPTSEGCRIAAADGLGAELPPTAKPGIYRWCGLDYADCYVFEYRPASFDTMFQVLTRWTQEAGDAWVPPNTEFEGVRLGLWADEVRYQGRRLAAEQIDRLESLPGWAWTPYRPSDRFPDMAPEPVFMATRRNWQRDDLGDPTSASADCARIDRWDSRQWLKRVVRTDKDNGWVRAEEPTGSCRMGGSNTITVDMPPELLQGIYRWCDLSYEECYVFEFVPGGFRRMLPILKRWIDESGDTAIPIEAKYRGERLGLWVDAMHYRHQHGTLTPKRTAQLEALPGWQWRTNR